MLYEKRKEKEKSVFGLKGTKTDEIKRYIYYSLGLHHWSGLG